MLKKWGVIMTTKRASTTSSGTKAAVKKPARANRTASKRPTKKAAGREQIYREVFAEPSTFLGPDEFMPQVNGYGTPTYAAVGTFAGV